MTTRLQLYNAALRLCGEQKLASLTEDRKPRYLLDDVWSDGGVKACLEKGFWQFATRSVQVDYDTAVTPAFGYNRAFSKASDWVKTAAVCSDEFFSAPLLQYADETGYIYASIDTIYVKYVSDGNSYGSDLSIWPEAFSAFAAAYFANEIVYSITGDENKKLVVEKVLESTLREAKNLNASANPQKFAAPGRWSSSRNNPFGRLDRGNRGSLIG